MTLSTLTPLLPDDCIDSRWARDAQRLINAICDESTRDLCITMAVRYWQGYSMFSCRLESHHEAMRCAVYRAAFRVLTWL